MRYLPVSCIGETAELSPSDDSDIAGSPAAVARETRDTGVSAHSTLLSA